VYLVHRREEPSLSSTKSRLETGYGLENLSTYSPFPEDERFEVAEECSCCNFQLILN